MARLLKDGSILMSDGRIIWGRDQLSVIDLRELNELLCPAQNGGGGFQGFGGGGRGAKGDPGPVGPPGPSGLVGTLDQAYDSGGAGAGRSITVDAGPVALVGGGTPGVVGLLSLSGSQSVASGAGATWKALSVAPNITITGNTHITTATGFNMVEFGAPTLSAASALTVDAAGTVVITGAPIGGGAGPVTITNPLSFWVQTGNVQFGTIGSGLFWDNANRILELPISGSTLMVGQTTPQRPGNDIVAGYKAQNSATAFSVDNPTSGTAALSEFIVRVDGTLATAMGVPSSGYTSASGVVAGEAYFQASTACTGLGIMTSGAVPIYIKTNRIIRWSIAGSDGLLLPGADASIGIGSAAFRIGDIYSGGKITLSGTQYLGPNGAATSGNVTYSWGTDPDTGMYNYAGNIIGFAATGAALITITNGALELASSMGIYWSSSADPGGGADVSLTRPSAAALKVTSTYLGIFGATPVVQQTAAGVVAGYTAHVTANFVYDATTFTGNVGATAYTIGDVVAALKSYGLLVS